MEKAPRRAIAPDRRGGGRYLRVTWHPESQTVVFSHWIDDVCVASTRIDAAAAHLVAALLEDAAPAEDVTTIVSSDTASA